MLFKFFKKKDKFEKACNNMIAISGILKKKYDTEKTIRLLNSIIPGFSGAIDYQIIKNQYKHKNKKLSELQELYMYNELNKYFPILKELCKKRKK